MIRQRSQSTTRDKLSLRNLLNIELESNYRSTNLQARPKTMYNQRQMKIFQQQRLKLMSEQKLHRSGSQHMARVRPTSVQQTEDKMEKNKLKHALGKINILADGSITVTQEERIASIYKFFQCLSKQFSSHSGLRTSIKRLLTTSMGPSMRQSISTRWSGQKNNSNSSQTSLKTSFWVVRLYNGVRDITYKELSTELFKQMGRKMVEMEEYRIKCEGKFAQLQSKLEDKNQVIKKMSSQITFYEDHPSKQQYGYIAELQQRVAQLDLDLRRAKSHIKELEDNMEYMTQYNNMLTERVEDLRLKIYDYEIVEFSNLKEIEKNSDLKEFENNVDVLKDLIHKGALRMASMREEYNKIQAYNQELLGERSVLAKRAAVGFAELTPRPNYKKIFSQCGLDYDKLVPEKPKPTTEELVTSLIKRFKDFYSKQNTGLKLVMPEREHGRPRADPAEPIMEDISRMGKQLKRVENLSLEVKSGYAKQKEQEKQLNKKNNK